MPEIWLNYGITDVVLDIKAENLEQKIDSDGKILDDQAITEKLNTLDLSKPMELVVLHNSKSILKIITTLFTLCEQKSKPFPKTITHKHIPIFRNVFNNYCISSNSYIISNYYWTNDLST